MKKNKQFIKEIVRQLNSINFKEYEVNDRFTIDDREYSITQELKG